VIELEVATLRWLLEPANPSVRAVTLRGVLGRPEGDAELTAARKTIPSSPWVTRLMRVQHREGYWANPKSCYLPKFTATVWHLQLLAELEMPRGDERVERACVRFLDQNTMPDGGFTCGSPSNRRRFSEECITGHMVATLRWFGLGNERKVADAMSWLLGRQRSDGGWNCDRRAGVRHSSFVSTLGAMKALASVPAPRRSPAQRIALERAAEFLLVHRLFRSHRTGKPVRRFWPPKLAFPAHYSYDLLQAPRILARTGVWADSRLAEALDLLESKRDGRGRWHVDLVPAPPNDAARAIHLERGGSASKWITAHALATLRRFGRVEIPSTPAV
jgi:hypothetical protein